MTHAYSARIALVGDRSPHVRSHHQVPRVLDRLREREGLDLDVYWVRTDEVDAMEAFERASRDGAPRGEGPGPA